ncbi:MAG: endolytic transglycosylase MltG, partial [Deltaproteobacteria bacterium]|nr:endolytic transglycosylase MltG [Deltaproteobacteria bacterium]
MVTANEKPVSRLRTRLITFALLFLFAVGYTAYDVMHAYPITPYPGTGKSVPFTVKRGIAPQTLVDDLARAAVISSPGKFGLWLRLTGGFVHVRAGAFLLTDSMSPEEIVLTLQGRGVNKGVRVTVPEGYTLSRIADVLEQAQLVRRD